LDKKIKLDRDLFNHAKQFAEAQGYSSMEEFISHLVEKEIARAEEDQSVEEIQKKMRGLGYFA
jgi:hypothetical protein